MSAATSVGTARLAASSASTSASWPDGSSSAAGALAAAEKMRQQAADVYYSPYSIITQQMATKRSGSAIAHNIVDLAI
jgi:hypothetical protein